jgi:hypothetical protein
MPRYCGKLSQHYATYAEFIGNSLTKKRVTQYCLSFEDCLKNEGKPFFRWRNISVYREFCYWKKKNGH